jgi:hypothetical protein
MNPASWLLDPAGTDGRLDVLWEDGERAFCRTWREASNGDRQHLMAVLPAAEYPTPG